MLSRLLTPHDTGLFTVGFALTVMIGMFRDFGVATYLLQEADLTDLKWRTALGVSIASCVLVFAALIPASFAAGSAYHDPAVTRIMLISGLTLLLIPFNSVIMIWLRRDLRFATLFKLSITGALIQALVTVGLAVAGDGAMSMAWGSVANSTAILVGSIRVRPRHFGYRPTLALWRHIAGFGIYGTIGNVGEMITPNGADLFVGRFLGLAALGQFSKGGALVSLVNQALSNAIMPVALALFARKRRDGEALDEALPLGLALLTGLTWPAFAGLNVIAGPVMRLLFGPQWNDAVAPAHLTLVGAMFVSLTTLNAMIFTATGALRTRMVVQLAVTPVQLIILFVAAQGSLNTAAMGSILCAAIEYLPAQIAANRICGTTLGAVARALLPSALVTLCTIVGPLLVVRMAGEDRITLIPMVVAVGIAGWAAGLALTRHPLGVALRPLLDAAFGTRLRRVFAARR